MHGSRSRQKAGTNPWLKSLGTSPLGRGLWQWTIRAATHQMRVTFFLWGPQDVVRCEAPLWAIASPARADACYQAYDETRERFASKWRVAPQSLDGHARHDTQWATPSRSVRPIAHTLRIAPRSHDGRQCHRDGIVNRLIVFSRRPEQHVRWDTSSGL
jgi:hypothetical protein